MRRREIIAMRTAANNTDSHTTGKAAIPFTYGTVHIQVDVWKKPVVDVTPQDGNTVDHVMAHTATAAWSQIDGLNALIAARSGLAAVDNGDYTATRSLTIGNTTVRVRLSFRLKVGVPTYIIHPIAEAILGKAMMSALYVVDPDTDNVARQDVAASTSQMMGGLMSRTFQIFAGLGLFGEPGSDSPSEDTAKPERA